MRSLSEHLEFPSIDGEIPADTSDSSTLSVEGCAGGSCGVFVRFYLRVSDTRIDVCNARVRGSSTAFTTASAFADAVTGLTVVEAAGVGISRLHSDFQNLEEDDAEHAMIVEDALHHALGTWVLEQARGTTHTNSAGAADTLVAMSGGVDSAVALHDRIDAGRQVVGATLRLWIDPKAPDPEAACCAPNSVRRARATCHAAGVPHFSLDLRKAFAVSVVTPFIEEYRAGLTPNPCVRCNGTFRLDELVRVADVLGIERIATGHYVRTQRISGRLLVQRGVDSRKDQSYMLATLSPDTIARFEFPLGDQVKDVTRKRAAQLQLVQANAAESQEICFLGGGDYRSFLERMDGLGKPGAIVDVDGNKLGTHKGVARFTPGQRRGIGITTSGGSSGPLYVVGTDSQKGTVTVGPRSSLRRSTVVIENAQAHLDGVQSANIRLRYRSEPTSARVEWEGNARATLYFDEPVIAPAPGQTACLYDDDGVVVGSGTIAQS